MKNKFVDVISVARSLKLPIPDIQYSNVEFRFELEKNLKEGDDSKVVEAMVNDFADDLLTVLNKKLNNGLKSVIRAIIDKEKVALENQYKEALQEAKNKLKELKDKYENKD